MIRTHLHLPTCSHSLASSDTCASEVGISDQHRFQSHGLVLRQHQLQTNVSWLSRIQLSSGKWEQGGAITTLSKISEGLVRFLCVQFALQGMKAGELQLRTKCGEEDG